MVLLALAPFEIYSLTLFLITYSLAFSEHDFNSLCIFGLRVQQSAL
jgi:hypothetical protein